MSLLAKLKSRKLWVTVGTAAAVALLRELGVELSAEELTTIGGIVGTYNLGQSYVDAKAKG